MTRLPSDAVGIGLRQPHFREVFDTRPALGFVEVHSENYFHDGGASLRALETARGFWPVSLHGVGLSLGSADGVAERHLARLKRLVDRIEPALVSEHLSWGMTGGRHLNDLLPVPRSAATLGLLVERVDRLQTALGRQVLIENVSAYVEFHDAAFRDAGTVDAESGGTATSETGFLAELARRSGCGLLLDVNNLYVNAVNFGFDASAALRELPPSAIGEIHLAGHAAVDGCLVDTHGTPVTDAVWALYREALAHAGRAPTLIEWDTDLPPLAVLLGEAAQAAALLDDDASRRPATTVGEAAGSPR